MTFKDSTKLVQQRIETAKRNRKSVEFPGGDLLITDTIDLGTWAGFVMRGCGSVPGRQIAGHLPDMYNSAATRFVWGGGEKPMFAGSIAHFKISDVAFADPDSKATAGLHITPTPGIGSGVGIIDNCSFDGQQIGLLCGSDEHDQNCADLTVRRCYFDNPAGFENCTAQNLNYFFDGCMSRGEVMFLIRGGGNLHAANHYCIDNEVLLQVNADGHKLGNSAGSFSFTNLAYDAQQRTVPVILRDSVGGYSRTLRIDGLRIPADVFGRSQVGAMFAVQAEWYIKIRDAFFLQTNLPLVDFRQSIHHKTLSVSDSRVNGDLDKAKYMVGDDGAVVFDLATCVLDGQV